MDDLEATVKSLEDQNKLLAEHLKSCQELNDSWGDRYDEITTQNQAAQDQLVTHRQRLTTLQNIMLRKLEVATFISDAKNKTGTEIEMAYARVVVAILTEVTTLLDKAINTNDELP